MSLERWPEINPEPEALSPGAVLLEQGFADRGETRVLKWASIGALCAHFLVFTAIFRIGAPTDLVQEPRKLTVIRRYQPPELPKKTDPRVRVRRRVAVRVPIPDPTPNLPEPLTLEEILVDFDPEEPVTEFMAGLPVGSPELSSALRMDTVGLEPPRLLEQVEPEYDAERARRGIQGATDLEIVIDTRGVVVLAQVINSSSDEELDHAAIEAVKKWRFAPGTIDGEPVPVRAVVTINFRIY